MGRDIPIFDFSHDSPIYERAKSSSSLMGPSSYIVAIVYCNTFGKKRKGENKINCKFYIKCVQIIKNKKEREKKRKKEIFY